jgi:hypothetical protein
MSTTRLFLIFFALMMALSIFIGIIAGLTYLNQQDLIKSQEPPICLLMSYGRAQMI